MISAGCGGDELRSTFLSEVHITYLDVIGIMDSGYIYTFFFMRTDKTITADIMQQ